MSARGFLLHAAPPHRLNLRRIGVIILLNAVLSICPTMTRAHLKSFKIQEWDLTDPSLFAIKDRGIEQGVVLQSERRETEWRFFLVEGCHKPWKSDAKVAMLRKSRLMTTASLDRQASKWPSYYGNPFSRCRISICSKLKSSPVRYNLNSHPRPWRWFLLPGA